MINLSITDFSGYALSLTTSGSSLFPCIGLSFSPKFDTGESLCQLKTGNTSAMTAYNSCPKLIIQLSKLPRKDLWQNSLTVIELWHQHFFSFNCLILIRYLPKTLSSLMFLIQNHSPAGKVHTRIWRSKKKETHVVGWCSDTEAMIGMWIFAYLVLKKIQFKLFWSDIILNLLHLRTSKCFGTLAEGFCCNILTTKKHNEYSKFIKTSL